VLIAGLLFVIGLLPLIVFNVRTGSTFHYIRNNVFATSYYDVDNTNLGENLRERIKELGSVINGETFFYLGGRPYASWRYTSVFVIAVGVLGFSVLARGTAARQGTARATGRPAVPTGDRAWAVSASVHSSRDTLYTWITIAAVVLPGYALYRLVGLKPHGRVVAPWYWLTLVLAVPAAALGIALRARDRADRVRAERRSMPRGWVQRTPHRANRWAGAGHIRYVLVALGSALLLMLFMYLAWKLARWKAPWLYVMGILALLLAPWLRAGAEARKILFPPLALAIALMASSFTPTGLLFTHLAILVPWPILVIAIAVDLIARRSGLDRLTLARIATPPRLGAALNLGTVLVLALVGMLVYDDLRVDVAYHRDLKRIGGIGDHTSASYALVEHLQQENASEVVAMDWGIQDVVQFLSEGTINPPQLSSYEDIDREDGAFALRVREHLDNPDTVYVFHVGAVFKNRWEAFQQVAAQEGRTPVEIKVVHDRAAIPIFRLVRVP
jgi:hypothetical protein